MELPGLIIKLSEKTRGTAVSAVPLVFLLKHTGLYNNYQRHDGDRAAAYSSILLITSTSISMLFVIIYELPFPLAAFNENPGKMDTALQESRPPQNGVA